MSHERLDELVDAGGTSSTQLSLFLINKRPLEYPLNTGYQAFWYHKRSEHELFLN